MRISKASMLVSMLILGIAAVPGESAQSRTAVQQTIKGSCYVIGNFSWPRTGTSTLVIEQINCKFLSNSTKPLEPVRLFTDKNDGELWFQPETGAKVGTNTYYTLNERIQYEVTPGALVFLAATTSNAPATQQSCTILGHYL
jgi:hypothetical protein